MIQIRFYHDIVIMFLIIIIFVIPSHSGIPTTTSGPNTFIPLYTLASFIKVFIYFIVALPLHSYCLVADLRGVRGAQMHLPLATSNVLCVHICPSNDYTAVACSNNNQYQFLTDLQTFV